MDEPISPGTPTVPSTGRLPADYLSDSLDEAELLLGYTAVSGIAVDASVRDAVLEARIATDAGQVTECVAENLFSALTSLATSVKPASVASLRHATEPRAAQRFILFYGIIASLVGGLIILISMATFFSSSVSDKIRVDIELANGVASRLRSELGPSPSVTPAAPQTPATTNLVQADRVWYGTDMPPAGLSDKDVIGDLQLFAATMREIHGYVKQLRFFVLDFDETKYTKAPGSLELDAGLDIRLSEELTKKVEEYQQVRNLGNTVQEKVTVYYGAVATCILPVLYSLLGAGAYLLRMIEDQIKTRSLLPGNSHFARFLIAGIGGLVVGLFNSFTSQGLTFSPFAVAFLVGYAVDVFFTFLEGLLQIFKKGAAGASASAAASPPAPSGPPN